MEICWEYHPDGEWRDHLPHPPKSLHPAIHIHPWRTSPYDWKQSHYRPPLSLEFFMMDEQRVEYARPGAYCLSGSWWPALGWTLQTTMPPASSHLVHGPFLSWHPPVLSLETLCTADVSTSQDHHPRKGPTGKAAFSIPRISLIREGFRPSTRYTDQKWPSLLVEVRHRRATRSSDPTCHAGSLAHTAKSTLVSVSRLPEHCPSPSG